VRGCIRDWEKLAGLVLLIGCGGFLAPSGILRAQSQQSDSQREKPADSPPAKQKPAKGSTDNATNNAADQPMWNPMRADKDIEVGKYYMNKGDVDAAIDRFQDAILSKPGYALPFRYLGEAQEKKGLKKQAIKSFRRYLDLYPHAEDAEKIQKKIDKLYKETEKK
jgi:tetratricopeptide (TPR) repeat protein